MKQKKKAMVATLIIAAAAVVALLLWLFEFRGGNASDDNETAWVETVSNLMDTGSVGMTSQYAGVVETQETWSVNKADDATVADLRVRVGDTVKKGDVLFIYDTSAYQSQLDQAGIDLQRMNNELKTMNDTLAQLQTQQKKAAASEQANYTIQIQEQQLSIQQKQLDIQSKQADIDKLNENIQNNQVTSGIDGVVRTINDGTSANAGSGTDANAYITIMKTGDLRVKGTVNEMNIGMLTEGTEVTIRSRVNSAQTWKGKITKIDTENATTDTSNGYYYSSGDSSTTSSKYPFYVELDSSDGLMLGQHVYIEPDTGMQDTVDKSEGIWLGSYCVDQSDPDNPFVWADNGHGRLVKKSVKTGETDEMMGEVQILEGITENDSIAFIDDTLHEGMKTAPRSEMPEDAVYSESTGNVISGSSYSGETYSGEDGAEAGTDTVGEDTMTTGTEGDVSGDDAAGVTTDGTADAE